MRVLFATTECAPWVKTGGLGDVSAALPDALYKLGCDVRLLMPAYGSLQDLLRKAERVISLPARGPWPAARLCCLPTRSFELWLLDCPDLYDRVGGPYVDEAGRDFADNAARFGFLSRIAADLCAVEGPWAPWRADILHANDWPTGLAPAYVSQMPAPRPATVFTIHNLAFQGSFDVADTALLGLPEEWMNVDGILHWERISMVKAALRFADVITTVSPTYAREIQTPAHGMGMDGMLRLRSGSLTGILNGIDEATWNPQTDRDIVSQYAPGQWRAKAENKRSLQEEFGLDIESETMLFAAVGRLTDQKGFDLVLANLDWLVAQGAQMVVLGRGDAALEKRLTDVALAKRGRIATRIAFDEKLAHRIEAGADCFLMPSRFEPCGLNQMYSLVYGTPPLVCATGGLADTVTDVAADPEGTGFVCTSPTAEALQRTLQRALHAFADKAGWHRLQRRGMQQSFGWAASAERYRQLYADALAPHIRVGMRVAVVG